MSDPRREQDITVPPAAREGEGADPARPAGDAGADGVRTALPTPGVPAGAGRADLAGGTHEPEAPRPGPAPDRLVVRVEDQDFRLLALFGVVGFIVLVLFFVYLRWGTTLLQFPTLDGTQSMNDYYLDALIYRERRMVFALTLRTFITGLSFIVGLALCTQGGIFILRQVTAATSLSGGWGRPAPGEAGEGAPVPESVARGLREAQFAFSSYSPGVVFLLGGVTIMALTLWLAVPIRAVEVIPSGSLALCQEEEGGEMRLCEVVTTERAAPAPDAAPAEDAPAPIPTDLGLPPLPPALEE